MPRSIRVALFYKGECVIVTPTRTGATIPYHFGAHHGTLTASADNPHCDIEMPTVAFEDFKHYDHPCVGVFIFEDGKYDIHIRSVSLDPAIVVHAGPQRPAPHIVPLLFLLSLFISFSFLFLIN